MMTTLTRKEEMVQAEMEDCFGADTATYNADMSAAHVIDSCHLER